MHEANEAARQRLRGVAKAAADLAEPHPSTALEVENGTILVVDRARPGHFLPKGQGVGLARKIGNDIALRLHAAGRVASPWIHNTDADVRLPNDYFDQTATIPEAGNAAALYFFEHRFDADQTLAEAARLYEISLRYYTLGLAWAGSPYAYQAMGSCIAIRPEAYAAVRGFPRKNAAEDFYVLDKLAKVGSIVRLAGRPLLLEGRVSRPRAVRNGQGALRPRRRRSARSRASASTTPPSSRTSRPGCASWRRRRKAADASTSRSRSSPARTRSS